MGQNDPPPVFSKYLSNFNQILAIPKLNIGKLNVLKFVKHSQVFGGKGLKIWANWKNFIFSLFSL